VAALWPTEQLLQPVKRKERAGDDAKRGERGRFRAASELGESAAHDLSDVHAACRVASRVFVGE
jgi:hypothetical protein